MWKTAFGERETNTMPQWAGSCWRLRMLLIMAEFQPPIR